MKSSKNAILLTGASGFAGVHMLKYLIENSTLHIYCPVTFTHGGHQKRIDSIIPKSFSHRFTTFVCDLSLENLNKFDFMSEVSAIINFASESHVDRSILNPRSFVSNNIDLMINLLEYTRICDPNIKFIHISTDEVFGSLKQNQDNFEWQLPHLPSNPYSASKSTQESLLVAYHQTYNLNTSIVNVTNMIGEGQNQEKFIPMTIKKIVEDKVINIDTNTKGEIGSRKYIYVGDVAKAISLILAVLNNSNSDGELPKKFHVSGSKALSNLYVVETISKIIGKEFKFIMSRSPRNSYDLRYQLSSKMMDIIQWKESKSIEDQIAKVVNWTIQNPEWLRMDYNS